mmetsp:Transcript_13455/g.31637  ORF Transcript_13455/g.31637 Transcript_13455/m.31637 type:complete len:217 (+) Transcript_13455:128-778(+)
MELAVGMPNQATRSFLEQRFSLTSNTFLNFQEENHMHESCSKRSRSIGCTTVRRSVGTVATPTASLWEGGGPVSQVEVMRSQGFAAGGETATREALTTVHVMNLPRRFTCSDLRHELDASGYEGAYDFAHVPVTFASGVSTGYALINFRSDDMAARLISEWQDSRRLCTRHWRHRKAMVLQAASVQGLSQFQTRHMARKTRRIKNPHFKPWFAANG